MTDFLSQEEKDALTAPNPAPAAQAPSNAGIEIILDVPLDVEVLLGSAHKRLDEIRALVPGASVELDKLVEEPVDITVNGTLIAQGEVVVVNENFGVRITNILAPAERLHRLRS